MSLNFYEDLDSVEELYPACEIYEPFGAPKLAAKSPANPVYENWKSGYDTWKNFHYFEDSNEAAAGQQTAPRPSRESNQTLPYANISLSRGAVDHCQPSLARSSVSSSREAPNELVPVAELPIQYRGIFREFAFFNRVQSVVFDAVFRSDANIIVSAPTSSGKTVIFELAIVRLLMNENHRLNRKANFKIVYVAPLKALCSEKFNDWREKFENQHGLKCIEVTGDSDFENDAEFAKLGQSNVIFTTPEKWDYVSRKMNNRHQLMRSIKLFIVDEIHVMGENSRGAVIEAVVSRMKAYSGSRAQDQLNETAASGSSIRFIAVSATIPNTQDFAEWLCSDSEDREPASVYRLNEEYRPVRIQKIVLGYTRSKNQSDYGFDLSLNYKLPDLIAKYSQSKPTLIFCSSRKGAQQAATMLADSNKTRYITSHKQHMSLQSQAANIRDVKLRELVSRYSIGYHHAGLDQNDRRIIENLFLNSELLVLMSTSTLAIGVNLPAHLVVIKSTKFYDTNQSFKEYSISQIQQMIGRAGRPQFDKSAVAVILTTNQDRHKYEALIEGKHTIESHLHTNLIEHINAEIVLGTITNLPSAIKWLKSTFLYIRLKKNPAYYGVLIDNSSGKRVDSAIDGYLTELCKKNLDELMSVSLIEKSNFSANNEARLLPTGYGRLMANYCVLFNTMSSFIIELNHKLATKNKSEEDEEVELDELDLFPPKKSLRDLILLIANSQELEDIKLRTSDKAALNAVNNNGKVPKKTEDMLALNKSPHLIRYRFEGRVKTNVMKTFILIQTELGSIPPTDASMVQDTFRIFRIGQRITKCMLEYLMMCYNHERSLKGNIKIFRSYRTFINAATLYQAFSTHLWHDSPHIFKQFPRIGSALSQALIDVGITRFEEVLDMSPRKLESILGKHPPFGSTLIHAVRQLPKFQMHFQIVKSEDATSSQYFEKSQDAESELNEKCSVVVSCLVENFEHVNFDSKESLLKSSDQIMFILGDSNDNLINVQRLTLGSFRNEGQWIKRIELNRLVNGCTIHASIILLNFVGLDIHQSFDAFEYEGAENEIDSFLLNRGSRSPSPVRITRSKCAKTKSSTADSKPSKDVKSVVDSDSSASDHESDSVKELSGKESDEDNDALTLEDATFSTESYGFDIKKASRRLNQLQSDSEDETDFGVGKSFRSSPQNTPKPKALARNPRSKSPSFSEKKRNSSASDYAYDDEPKIQEDYSVFSKLKKTRAPPTEPRQLTITECLKRTQSKLGISSVAEAPNPKRVETAQPAPTPKPASIVKTKDFSQAKDQMKQFESNQRIFKFKSQSKTDQSVNERASVEPPKSKAASKPFEVKKKAVVTSQPAQTESALKIVQKKSTSSTKDTEMDMLLGLVWSDEDMPDLNVGAKAKPERLQELPQTSRIPMPPRKTEAVVSPPKSAFMPVFMIPKQEPSANAITCGFNEESQELNAGEKWNKIYASGINLNIKSESPISHNHLLNEYQRLLNNRK